MKKLIIVCFFLTSLFSEAQNNSIAKTTAPLACNITLVGTSNPTSAGACNGTATISLAACSNPPYDIMWFNSNPNSSCQSVPPAQSAFTGTLYVVNTLCGCPTAYSILITNSAGEQAFIQITITDPLPTGFYDLSDGTEVFVTPNPATDVLNIDLKTPNIFDSGIEIENAMGQTILSSVINPGKQVIDLKNIPNGIYFVRFQRSGQQTGFKKIVVQK